MNNKQIKFLDCTLRDGGYYNAWDFDKSLINKYLIAMQAAGIDAVEIGLRSLQNSGFKGACAFSTDTFICNLEVPAGLILGVMVNAAELISDTNSLEDSLETMFPKSAKTSPVKLVRIACHVHEFSKALPAANWLKEKGFIVGFNLMQVADRSRQEIINLSQEANNHPLDVLYFADSMGSMDPRQTSEIIEWLREGWSGPLGIHTHDNMGMALQNTLQAIQSGVTWVDATVTGMGRGPGNARTEELSIEIADMRQKKINMIPLMQIIKQIFKPMQHRCGWGTNPYYYLAGKYGIHPSYIQEMQSDSRYDEEDILAVIDYLKNKGGKKFSLNVLTDARDFYQAPGIGNWEPASLLHGKEVLLLGTGPSVNSHREALENYIKKTNPIVVALNTQTSIDAELIDLRIACHPVRLLADCQTHTLLPQPLITPFSMLPFEVQTALQDKLVYDFGLSVKENVFSFDRSKCTVPNSQVVSYALAVASSGNALRICVAGFDGYGADDPRTKEMQKILEVYKDFSQIEIVSITPTIYGIPIVSVYAMAGH